MAALFGNWLIFGAVWLVSFYYLARAGRTGALAAISAIWLAVLILLAVLIWFAPGLFHKNHDHSAGLTLYFYGHLVYGLCSLAGWKLGRTRRWRRKLKLIFRRCADGFRKQNRLRS